MLKPVKLEPTKINSYGEALDLLKSDQIFVIDGAMHRKLKRIGHFRENSVSFMPHKDLCVIYYCNLTFFRLQEDLL